MKRKEEIINYLIDRYDFKSYLEIGVQNAKGNFSTIKCDYPASCEGR